VIQFKKSVRVLPVGALLLGLTLYSYHLRELLVCWVFFSVLFVCMMLVFLMGELGVSAGERVTVWVRSAAETTPASELTAIEFAVKSVSEPRKLN
jgi:hypothetical protein